MATATKTKSSSKPKTKRSAKVNFRPLDDRILVRQSAADDKTTGGIILPDSAKEKPQSGRIIAVGPGKLLDSGKRGEMSVRVGDEVFYGKYAGTEIEFAADSYVVLRENDVLAIVDK